MIKRKNDKKKYIIMMKKNKNEINKE